MLAKIVFLCVCVTVALGLQTYRGYIPNGMNVPNPCGDGIWAPVGHFDPVVYTSKKNPFGLDFAAAGHQWTPELCAMDSDGDGVSNGDELGDASCSWARGDADPGTPKGHPGICEPIGSCGGDAWVCPE